MSEIPNARALLAIHSFWGRPRKIEPVVIRTEEGPFFRSLGLPQSDEVVRTRRLSHHWCDFLVVAVGCVEPAQPEEVRSGEAVDVRVVTLDAGDQGCPADGLDQLHALRHLYVRLTRGVYSHLGLVDLAGAVTKLPGLDPAPGRAALATGTGNVRVNLSLPGALA